MKFMVRRTSGVFDNDKPPCPGATQEQWLRIDEVNVDHPDKIRPEMARMNWFVYGRNHRIEDGKCKRDFERMGWSIEIETLDALLSFVDKHGDIVLGRREDTYAGLPGEVRSYEIEIYDDYRE